MGTHKRIGLKPNSYSRSRGRHLYAIKAISQKESVFSIPVHGGSMIPGTQVYVRAEQSLLCLAGRRMQQSRH